MHCWHKRENSGGEPKTHKQAINSENKGEWLKAMKSEIDSLRQNNTWELVERPKGRKIK